MLTQILLISQSGFILKSAGNLLPSHWLLHHSARETFPIIESLWPYLQNLKAQEPSLRLDCVAQPHPKLAGFYCFSFRQTGGHRKYLELSIQCCTEQALQFRKKNQQQNEARLLP
ncbi:MAG: hypothetical protein KDD02_16675 [Phaeodactylibacter sp.]|nr:hypothetical protein [Phaeodactylibacter sp.]MCB9299692.1 hypothetical protein [Lewinellaceae bacterium]